MPTPTPLSHGRRRALDRAADLYRYDPAAGERARRSVETARDADLWDLEGFIAEQVADLAFDGAQPGEWPAWRPTTTAPTYGGGPDPDDDPPPW